LVCRGWVLRHGTWWSRYRHLKVDQGASGLSFYHLNCEHGTGEAICEFSNASDINVYGFKAEGNVVALWVRADTMPTLCRHHADTMPTLHPGDHVLPSCDTVASMLSPRHHGHATPPRALLS